MSATREILRNDARRGGKLQSVADGDPVGRRHSPPPRRDRRPDRRREDLARRAALAALPRNQDPRGRGQSLPSRVLQEEEGRGLPGSALLPPLTVPAAERD